MLRKVLIAGLAMALLGGAARADGGASIDADGTITIHPGESVSIVFDGKDDLSHPKLATSADGPAQMTFAFKQQEGLGLMLMIENHLDVMVKYDATMVVKTPNGERSAHTSICPVLAGRMGTESWMDPIVALKLSGFRKADLAGGMVCD